MDFLNTAVGKVLSSGAVVNFFTVVLGSLVGILFKKGIPERLKTALMTGMALCVLYIGITGLFEEQANIIIIIVSMGLGALIGELIDLDRLVNQLGKKLENAFGKGETKLAEGFVAATLLFCVGAMTIVGSINSGLEGDNSTLYSKAIIDGVAAVALTSSFGIGVIFSSLSVLVIQGSITLLAAFIAPILTEYAVEQMSVIGSLLIIALATNMLGLTKIKVMNYILAIFIPLIICLFI